MTVHGLQTDTYHAFQYKKVNSNYMVYCEFVTRDQALWSVCSAVNLQ